MDIILLLDQYLLVKQQNDIHFIWLHYGIHDKMKTTGKGTKDIIDDLSSTHCSFLTCRPVKHVMPFYVSSMTDSYFESRSVSKITVGGLCQCCQMPARNRWSLCVLMIYTLVTALHLFLVFQSETDTVCPSWTDEARLIVTQQVIQRCFHSLKY